MLDASVENVEQTLVLGSYFDPVDYHKCVGLVFQIYRAAGAGQVKIGDDVGFYYPKYSGVNSRCDTTPNFT